MDVSDYSYVIANEIIVILCTYFLLSLEKYKLHYMERQDFLNMNIMTKQTQ
jgi:hypothetical protein